VEQLPRIQAPLSQSSSIPLPSLQPVRRYPTGKSNKGDVLRDVQKALNKDLRSVRVFFILQSHFFYFFLITNVNAEEL
jgi:hypothetical protein